MKKIFVLMLGLLALFGGSLGAGASVDNITFDAAWINGTRLYMQFTYSGNETYSPDIGVVLYYSGFQKEYSATVLFSPNETQQFYVDLDTGYLKSILIKVNGNPVAFMTMNTLISPKEYGITVVKSCNETVVNGTCEFEAKIYYPEMTQCGVMWSYDGEHWKNETYYPKTDIVFYEFNLKPEKAGDIKVKFFLKVDGVYVYSTKEYSVHVNHNFELENDIYNIVSYQYENISVTRDYHYSPNTDNTLVVTHITYTGDKEFMNAEIQDWLPPTIAPSLKKVYFEPVPDEVSRRDFHYVMALYRDKTVELKYLVHGKVDPILVATLPTLNISARGEIVPQRATRVYHIGNITVNRTMEYMPEINKTVVSTFVYGMDVNRSYIISDELPGYKSISEIDVIPDPHNYTRTDSGIVVLFQVNGTEAYHYIYRLPGHVSLAYIDAIGKPTISYANLTNETSSSTHVKVNPLTGFISFLEAGLSNYVAMLISGAIVAFALLYLNSRTSTEVIEATEEDMILAEME